MIDHQNIQNFLDIALGGRHVASIAPFKL
jgi:hypothetical protein